MTRRFLLLLFFASGCAALIYEIVWFYLVELIVGASSISVAVLLASFMGGMALGSLLLPRVVPNYWHPLKVVACLEFGIGAIGLAMPFLLPLVQQGYIAVAGTGAGSILLRAAVCAVVLIPPTLLMGATLPAVSRWTASTPNGAATVGLLYMANILGGAMGTALAGFYLLRVFDTVIASLVAAALNLVVGIGVWALAHADRSVPAGDVEEAPVATEETAAPTMSGADARLVYAVAALSGFTALGAEVVWTRQVSLLFGASVYTFSLILAIFLAGLGGGSVIGASIARRSETPARALAICQMLLVACIAWAAWAIVNLLPQWQPTTHFLANVRSSPFLAFAFDALRGAAAFGPATLCWGASFPLAIAAVATPNDPDRSVARLNAINTVGALAGALGLTMIGIPMLGSTHAQQALVVAAGVSAALLVLRAPGGLVSTAALVAATIGAIFVVPPVPGALIAYGRSVDSWNSIKQFLYVAEGATASVAVTEGTGGARQFHIAGKVEASDMDIDMRLERMLGHVPALIHGKPRRVLVVGNGAGVTAGALAAYPDIERIVICEIEPVVPASARRYFADVNEHVLDDPRVQVVYDDGRHFLQTTNETFDLITTDPIHPWVRGAATLYSLEYLQLVRARLAPGGVVTQWVPLYETDAASVKSQLATFAEVFPDMTLWNPDLLEEGYDLVVLGRTSQAAIDERQLALAMHERPTVARSMGEVSLPTVASLLGTYAGRGQDLAPWLTDAQINRERHLRLQYLAGLAANTDYRFSIFQSILEYRRYPADLFVTAADTEMQLRAWMEKY